jgi:glutamine amidotransferase
MSTVVVDYDAGNLRSVQTALEHLGAAYTVERDPAALTNATRIVFPGVGDGAHAMSVLRERELDRAMREQFAAGVPILGICVGCQIVFDMTEEQNAECLGLIPGRAARFPDRPGMKVPHMGWNTVSYRDEHWLFSGVPQDASFYFVHSYYPSPESDEYSIAQCDYGFPFAAAVERDSLVATQFHPEKSGEVGLQILRNFLQRGES